VGERACERARARACVPADGSHPKLSVPGVAETLLLHTTEHVVPAPRLAPLAQGGAPLGPEAEASAPVKSRSCRSGTRHVHLGAAFASTPALQVYVPTFGLNPSAQRT
jgi:hypothetical protein